MDKTIFGFMVIITAILIFIVTEMYFDANIDEDMSDADRNAWMRLAKVIAFFNIALFIIIFAFASKRIEPPDFISLLATIFVTYLSINLDNKKRKLSAKMRNFIMYVVVIISLYSIFIGNDAIVIGCLLTLSSLLYLLKTNYEKE